jgi:putative DNA primase/helicase
MDPGCKVDTCLVLQGTQGIMKSSFFSTMGGEWFSDTYVDMSNKDSYAQISAAWIYELGEIDQVLSGRNEERFKGWLASTHDTYRAPYDRVAKKHPRGCVVVGTANPEEFLRDPTGNRRYWIVRVGGKIDVKIIATFRDQLWAEAVCAYDAGETWWLDDQQELEREASNEDHHEHDPWEEIIGAAIGRPGGADRVTMSAILADVLHIDIAQQGRKEQMRAARIMRWAGWRRRRSTSSWFYEAPIDGPRWPTRATYERDSN